MAASDCGAVVNGVGQELNPTENSNQVQKGLDDKEILLREVRSILNKLTPRNLEKLTSDLINLAKTSIKTQEHLEDAADIIYEMSINEKLFSTTYAKLCRGFSLSKIKVPITKKPGKSTEFR